MIEDRDKNELVSIIVPSYNTGKYLNETIESVIKQTYQNWELIIVDDCSADNTEDVIKKWKDTRIKFIKNRKNYGAAVCRNYALRKAKGRWIAFLDSDDLWKPEKLEKQIKFMLKNKYYFTYTNYEEMDGNSNITGKQITGPKHISKRGMYNYCWPGCLTVMYDRNFIGEIQVKNIRKNNDYAMWLKVIQKSDCWLLNECLAYYRKRNGSISNVSYLELIKWHFKLFYEAEQKNKFMSIWLTVKNILFGIYKKCHYVHKKNIS